MKNSNVFMLIWFYAFMCLFITGCLSQQKQEAVLESYSKVVGEYVNINTEYIKLLEWVKTKNPDNTAVLAELDKAIEEAETSKELIGTLSVDIEAAIKSSTLDEEQKALFLEILDMVLPPKEPE